MTVDSVPPGLRRGIAGASLGVATAIPLGWLLSLFDRWLGCGRIAATVFIPAAAGAALLAKRRRGRAFPLGFIAGGVAGGLFSHAGTILIGVC